MRLKNALHFAVLDDPFLDLFDENGGVTQFMAFRYTPASAPQTQSPVHDHAIAKLSEFVSARHAALGAPTIQDPDVVITPVEPSPAGGPPIQDPDVVIVPPIEPDVERPPVQDSAVLPISPAPPTIVAPLLGGAAVLEQAAASISGVVGPQHAPGATPPIQDPNVVVVPPLDPNPGGGPSIQGPDVIIAPPPEPSADHPTVQDAAFVSVPPPPVLSGPEPFGAFDAAAPWFEPGAVPIGAADWWLVG